MSSRRTAGVDSFEGSQLASTRTAPDASLPEWDVHCEFNCNGHDPKRLQLNPEQVASGDDTASTVYPDSIIHCRGTDDNLPAIEIKKVGGGSQECDMPKLGRMRSVLTYFLGCFVRFSVEFHNAGVEHVEWSADQCRR